MLGLICRRLNYCPIVSSQQISQQYFQPWLQSCIWIPDRPRSFRSGMQDQAREWQFQAHVRHMITTGIQNRKCNCYRLRIHRWPPVLVSAGPVWSGGSSTYASYGSIQTSSPNAIAKLQLQCMGGWGWGIMPSLLISSALPQLLLDLHHDSCGYVGSWIIWFGTLSHSCSALFFSSAPLVSPFLF